MNTSQAHPLLHMIPNRANATVMTSLVDAGYLIEGDDPSMDAI
jgi:hypothetical protein